VRGAAGDRRVTLALDGVGGKIGRETLELLGTQAGWSCSGHRPAR